VCRYASGEFGYAVDQFELRAARLTVPLLLTTGRDDGMGGFEG
jgi:hypothetical protein